MPTGRLQAAHDALVSVGVPESVVLPYKTLLEERQAKSDQNYETSLQLEHMTAARKTLAKRREELQND